MSGICLRLQQHLAQISLWFSQTLLLVEVIFIFHRCGKTTQIPQFILDSHLKAGHGGECFIICTQPRRISAMSVAERVSAERVDKIGESVGYQVRLENKQVKLFTKYEYSLLFC